MMRMFLENAPELSSERKAPKEGRVKPEERLLEILWRVAHHDDLITLEERRCKTREEAVKDAPLPFNLEKRYADNALLRKMFRVVDNREVVAFLEEKSWLRVFEVKHFDYAHNAMNASSTTAPKQGIDVDLLCSLVSTQFGKDAKGVWKITKSFAPEARKAMLLAFFKIVAVVATLAGWIPGEGTVSPECVCEILERYTKPTWNSKEMCSQSDDVFHIMNMVDGWNIVHQVMMIRLQEVHAAHEVKSSLGLTGPVGSFPTRERDNCTKVQLSDVEDDLVTCVTEVVTEFVGWISTRMDATNLPVFTVHGIMTQLSNVFLNLLNEVLPDRDHSRSKVDVPSIVNCIERIRNEHATMAEMKYDPVNLLPAPRAGQVKTPIQVATFYQRCRSPKSPVMLSQGRIHMAATLSAGVRSTTGDRTGTSGTPNWMNRPGISSKRSVAELREWEKHASAPLPVKHSGRFQDADDVGQTETPSDPGRYSTDALDSDNEFGHTNHGDGHVQEDVIVDQGLERFFAEVLGWHIEPDATHSANVANANGDWLDYTRKVNKRALELNLESPMTEEEYKSYWKVGLTVETRAVLVDAMCHLFPLLTKYPEVFAQKFKGDKWHEVSNKVRFVVRKVGHSRLLTNVRTDSTDPILNAQLAKTFTSYTLGFGYLCRGNKESITTPLHPILCRAVHLEGEDIDRVGAGAKIDYIRMRMCMNRRSVSRFRVQSEDILYMQPLYSMASVVRMYKAILSVDRLPVGMQAIIHGKNTCGPVAVNKIDIPSVKDAERGSVDEASWEYLRKCQESKVQMDERQTGAVAFALGNLGACNPESTSLTLVQGPPGTGKTKCINLYLGGILHHSVVGHVGKQQFNECDADDGLVRCSKSPECVRVLICCASNPAVDNVLERIADGGIPDGNGGVLIPRLVRVARRDYPFGDLRKYSLNDLALAFDRKLFHPDDPSRTSASSRARHTLARECVVVLMTLSLSGSTCLQQLRVPFDVVLVDESAQALEPEILVPLICTRRRSKKKRLHVVLFGDHRQLEAVSKISPLLRNCHVPIPGLDRFSRSLFERVHVGRRVPAIMLNRQYRMSRHIAGCVLPPFYSQPILSPLPEAQFDKPYNSHRFPDVCYGFHRMTFLNTGFTEEHQEMDDGTGRITNQYEAEVVVEVIRHLLRFGPFDMFQGNISVMAPYASQVELLTQTISSHRMLGGYSVRDLGVRVQTVDSMQGKERDIVIFSATRSNKARKIGFLDKINRLNVASSRSRNLFVLIGDALTLCDFPNHPFNEFHRKTVHGGWGLRMVMCHKLKNVSEYTASARAPYFKKRMNEGVHTGDGQVDKRDVEEYEAQEVNTESSSPQCSQGAVCGDPGPNDGHRTVDRFHGEHADDTIARSKDGPRTTSEKGGMDHDLRAGEPEDSTGDIGRKRYRGEGEGKGAGTGASKVARNG